MDPRDRRARLEARNAAMRRQVDSLLDGLHRQAAALKSAQARAGEVTSQATSADGLVTVTVNAAGIVTDVQFKPSVFDRCTPDKLARGVVAASQRAAADAQRKVDAVLAPIRGELPDLPDVFPEAPALRDLLPGNPRPQRPPAPEDDDFSTRSVLQGGDR